MVFVTEKKTVLPQLFYHKMWYKYNTTITAVVLFTMEIIPSYDVLRKHTRNIDTLGGGSCTCEGGRGCLKVSGV